MHLILFDPPDPLDLAPLSHIRPACLMRTGAMTLLERAIHALKPRRLTILTRATIAPLVQAELNLLDIRPTDIHLNTPPDNAPAVLLDGRVVVDDTVAAHLRELDHRSLRDTNDRLVAIHSADPQPTLERLMHQDCSAGSGPASQVDARRVRHPWDMLTLTSSLLGSDLSDRLEPLPPVTRGPWHLVGPAEHARVDPSATIGPNCVLDTTAGPIRVEANATVGPGSVIEGPCLIGRGSTILPLTIVRPGTVLGPVCKVGGEISNSIFLGYSNKQHHGYMGDSILGMWVNLGAGVVTSNLKNTLGVIRVRQSQTRVTDSARQFLGAILADHARLGIGTLLPPGAVVGLMSHVAGRIQPPTFVPSARLLTETDQQPLRLEKAIEVARAVMARRNIVLDQPTADALLAATQAAAAMEAV